MNVKELKEKYFSYEDITEYQFAIDTFGSLDKWFSYVDKNTEQVDRWRKEMEIKIKSNLYKLLLEETRKDSKESISSAKFLLGKGVLKRDKDELATKEEVITSINKPSIDNNHLRLILNEARS